MNKRFQLRPALRGVSEDQGEANQLPMTSPKARNVRALDPETGRVQMAQRAGYTDALACSLPARVEAAATVTYDHPKTEFVGPGEGTITVKWERITPCQNCAPGLAVDFEGNVYAIDGDGVFIVYGPDGAERNRTTIWVPQLEKVVERIQVDSNGNVYVATTNGDGFSSTLSKYERVENEDDTDTYDLAWRWQGLWGIRDFAVRAGLCAVARFYGQGEEGDEENITVLSQLYATAPVEAGQSAVPSPVTSVDFNEAAEILFSVDANANRGGNPITEEGWTARLTLFSPHEISNGGGGIDATGNSFAQRAHFWIDADTVANEHVNNDSVTRVKDRRWLHTQIDPTELKDGMAQPDGDLSYVAPTDLTARPAKGDLYSNFRRPIYKQTGAGPNPTIHFIGPEGRPPWRSYDDYGSVFFLWDGTDLNQNIYNWKVDNLTGGQLRLGENKTNSGQKSDTSGDDLPDADGLMENQGSIIPGGPNTPWAAFFLVRCNPSTHGEVIFHHRSRTGDEFAILHNMHSSSTYASGDKTLNGYASNDTQVSLNQNHLSVFIGRVGDFGSPLIGTPTGYTGATTGTAVVDTTAFKIPSVNLATGEYGDPAGANTSTTSTDYWDDFSNDRGVALISIVHNGKHGSGEVDDSGGTLQSDGNSMVRINGRLVCKLKMTSDLADAIYTGAIFGGSTDEHGHPGLTHLSSWHGDLMEAIGIVGGTSGASSGDPNPNQVRWPGVTDSDTPADPFTEHQWTDMTGFSYDTSPDTRETYTAAACTVEQMEGYLAYKHGCGDILPGAGVDESTGAGVFTGTGSLGLGNLFQAKHPFAYGEVDGSGAPWNTARPPVGRAAAGGVTLGPSGVALLSPKEIVAKMNASGEIAWALSGNGHGLGVLAGPDRSVLTVGRHDGSDTTVAKRLKDLGSSYRATGDDTWAIEEAANPARVPVRGLATDVKGNLYWPREDARQSVLLQFTSNPANADIVALSVEGGTRGFIFRNTLSGSDPVSVQIESTAIETALNFVAAVNDTGTAAQYSFAIGVPSGGLESWSAQYSFDVVPHVRLTRKGAFTAATISINPGIGNIDFDEYPSDATITGTTLLTLKAQKEARLELRDAEDGSLTYDEQFGEARALAVATDPVIPLWPEDDDREGTAENVYVGLFTDGTEDDPTIKKLAQVKRRQVIGENASPRRTAHVAVSAGHLYQTPRGGAPSVVELGARRFNPLSPFTKLWVYRQKLYGLDGLNYVVWDPKTNRVEEWEAEGAGKIPQGAKLACVFGDRIVLARTDDDPHNLHMSGRGSPDDWDTDPTVLTPLSAFSGNSTGNLHFRSHDLVNCIIPARDDLLYIGGAQSFTRLTGDPGGQGQMDNVSQLEGMAFGDAWAVGPSGEVYVKGQNTGIWRLAPNGGVDLITEGWIERRMQDIDLATYDVVMAWSFRQRGLHVYVTPKVEGPAKTDSYWWDAKTGGWWPDDWSDEAVQPVCTAVWDGDEPTDRGVVIGSEDGMLRIEDELATDDGAYRIESEVVLGPLTPGELGQVLFTALEPVLVGKPGYGGVWLEVYTGATPDFQGGDDPVFEHYVGAGYGGDLAFTALGNELWVRLRNGAFGEKWALQSLFARAREAGARRM